MDDYNLQDNDHLNVGDIESSPAERDLRGQRALYADLSFLVRKTSTSAMSVKSEIFSINCCKHTLLKWSLCLYGFSPSSEKYNCCQWIYRFIIFVCVCMGFWSLKGLSTYNHGSNYLATIVDFAYPSIYVTSLIYFTNSNHFWKACSIRDFVMTDYTRRYITVFLLFGILTTFGVATWQKLIWFNEHVHHWKSMRFVMWLVFYITFLLRLYILFLSAIIFWLVSRFHKRQIKVYLRNIILANIRRINMYKNIAYQDRRGSDDDDEYNNATWIKQYDQMFDILVALRTDLSHTNEQVQGYLLVLLITVLISLIVLVSGLLFGFIEIHVFIDEAGDLFIMAVVAIYVLICAAQATDQFNSIEKELTLYYHQQIAFVEWDTANTIQFLSYASKNLHGFKLCGVLLDYGTVLRYCVLLASGFLSTFGKRFYS
eukprot:228003_1